MQENIYRKSEFEQKNKPKVFDIYRLRLDKRPADTYNIMMLIRIGAMIYGEIDFEHGQADD